MLLIFVCVMWISTSAIGTKMCVLSPMKWIGAMKHCQSLGGSPLSNYYIPERVVSQLSFSSVWTSDYAALKPATGNTRPEWCQYITIAAYGQSGGVQIGNCNTEKNYICCESGKIDSRCIRTGTWYQAKVCKKLHFYSEAHSLPRGDYWLTVAYSFENFTFPAQYQTAGTWSSPTVYRCGMLDVNGVFQFVYDCSMKHYSICVIDNYPEDGIADCIQTKTTQHPNHMVSSSNEQAPIDPNFSNKRDSRLAIGFGVGVPILVCVLIVITVVAVYMRRNSQLTETKNGRVNAHTEINATYGVSDNRVDLHVDSFDESASIGDYSTIPDNIQKPADYEDVLPDENGDASFTLESDTFDNKRKNIHRSGSRAGGHVTFGKPDLTPESNTVMNTVYFTRIDTREDYDYCNTDVMSDEYDSIHFSKAPGPVTLNVYSRLGDGKNDNHYNVASCGHKPPADNIDDYDKLN